MAQAYTALEQVFHRINTIEGTASLLHWDASTMMPSGSGDMRAEQLATLEALAHELLVEEKTQDLLEEAREESDLDAWQAANLMLMEREVAHARAVPAELLEKLTKASLKGEIAWRECREKDAFGEFAPHQETVLALVKEIAALKGEALGCSPYDALLDQYDPGRTREEIDTLFTDLKAFLPDFLEEVLAQQAAQQAPVSLGENFPVEAQEAVGKRFMSALGFDFTQGRIDTSHHPFCGGIPGDVRLTTRYDATDFTKGMMGVLHETGHALYEQGLPGAWRHQPVGQALGMSIHESQSLLIEMQVCRSEAFLSYAAPLLAEAFHGDATAWAVENLYRVYRTVERSLIRVDADEVTYPLHVILRYELEKALIDGTLTVKELPGAWNEQMQTLVGIAAPNDKDGCMQDIHWPEGAFGYFPTYTLGAMCAAQFYGAAKEQVPEIEAEITKGNFAPLLGWLREHVHSAGSHLPAAALVEKVTGKKLDSGIYEEYLKNKYLN